MEEAIFTPTSTYVDGKLDDFLNARLTSVIDVVQEPLLIGLTLYIVLYGFAILRGSIQEPLMDFGLRSLKLVAIYLLATTAAYSDFVTQPLFHGLPNTIAEAVSGKGVTGIGEAFDTFLANGMTLSLELFDEAGPLNWPPAIIGFVVLAATVVASVVGFGITVLAKVSLALIIALGPIFVACCLFDASRKFFFGWLSQAINYVLTFALIITVTTLVLDLVQSQFGGFASAEQSIPAGVFFSVLCVLASIFFLQVPAIAAGIAGGAASGINDFANARRSAQQAATAAVGASAKGAYVAGRHVGRRMVDRYQASRNRGGSVTPTEGVPRRPGAGSGRRT